MKLFYQRSRATSQSLRASPGNSRSTPRYEHPWLGITDLDQNTAIFYLNTAGKERKKVGAVEGALKEGEKDAGGLDWFHIDQFAWGRNKYSYLLTAIWSAGL